MTKLEINTISGNIDNIYINFIKKANSDDELKNVKNKYILTNPFVSLNDKKFYLGYINKLNRKKLLANIFLKKVKKKKEKREKILSRFVNIIKYNILVKKNPCNDTDLYTLDEYNKNNKNIYVIDIKNTKWWFTIETMCKLICSNLSYFDTETYSVMCKEPINPFINKPFNKGQLINIYEQLEKYKKIPKIFMLYRIANFDINYYLKIFNNEIINYSYKYNLCKLDNETILLFLENLFNDNNVYHTNISKLNLENSTVKTDTITLIKHCMLTYKKIKERILIRRFINKYNFIIKKAKRNTVIVLDDETEINLSDQETENETDEDYVEEENEIDEDYIEENEIEEDYVEEENLVEEQMDDIELDNFVSDLEIPQSQENRLTDYISTEEDLFYIQAYIRGYLERKKINELKKNIIKINSYFKVYLERQKMKNKDIIMINELEKMNLN